MISECFRYNQHFVAMMNIINMALRRARVEGSQLHHIVPKAFFKSKGIPVDNSDKNLVPLTPEEHSKVHKLISLCCVDSIWPGMKRASNFLNGESSSGKNNPFFGHRHSLEQRRIWSEKKKGHWVGDKNPSKRPEVREKLKKSCKASWTEERRAKYSEFAKSRRRVYDDNGKWHWTYLNRKELGF